MNKNNLIVINKMSSDEYDLLLENICKDYEENLLSNKVIVEKYDITKYALKFIIKECQLTRKKVHKKNVEYFKKILTT